MAPRLSRRSVLELSAAAGGLALLGCASTRRPARETLRHAGIGVGGMGAEDLKQIASHPRVEVVALCDIDGKHLAAAAARHPDARLYRDWRELLKQEAGGLDSVHVTTPDHMHAPIELAALRKGLHVYGQKPLTRTVAEARAVAAATRAAGVVTQMGIQNHSNAPYRQALALFQAGHIGKVHEVHVWTDRPAGWWPQGVGRPEGSDPVPEHVDWDGFLGVAKERPHKRGAYHPFKWRGWVDFGTGAQGDMACHLMDPAVWFLGLGHPTRLRSDGPTHNGETFPTWSTVHYEFPPNEHTTRGPLHLTWYDGGRKAPKQLLADLGVEDLSANACLFVGTEGALVADPYSAPTLLPAERFAAVELPQVETFHHWHQWVAACLGEGEAHTRFAYSAHLTEVALLGNVALQFPHETLEWDGAGMRFPGRPEASALLRGTYRKGWEVRGLS